jgi:hypothetical protein
LLAVDLTPSFSGMTFGTCVHGAKFDFGGVPVTKSVRIGEAIRSY